MLDLELPFFWLLKVGAIERYSAISRLMLLISPPKEKIEQPVPAKRKMP
jgi:hypothetical protein